MKKLTLSEGLKRLGARLLGGALLAGILAVLGSSLALAATLPPATCSLVGTTRTCDLYAVTGTMPAASLPAAPAAGVPVWGYNSTNAPVTAPGGPTLIANQGETLVINLHNINLPSATSLMISGQSMIPDTTGVTLGNSTTYTVTALTPGTFLYEAGLTSDGPRQVAMGLYGALIVRPATNSTTTAYGGTDTSFDDEAVLVLSEIDPAFNAAPTTFDMTGYAPKYWLINGKVYPNTDAIATDVNRKVLLRYVNAGLMHHSMALAGLHQTIYATDALTETNPLRVVAQTIPAGGTLDTIVTMPASAPANAKYALFEAAMHVDNTGAATGGVINFGGMLTFLTVGGTPVTSAPVTSNVAVSPNLTNGSAPVTLSASVQAFTGTVQAAEYFVDTVGANNAGCAMSGTYGGATANVSANIPTSGATAPCMDLTTLSSGNHIFYVHGFDGTNWGLPASAVLNLDKTGPTVGNMSLTPNRTNGSVDVALQATASDVTTGNQYVTAAEYFIDSQPATNVRGTALTMATPAPSVSLTATISAATVLALPEGTHTIAVRAQDALGNWGAFGTIALTVDKTGPVSGNVSATPNPNNGTLGVQVGTGGGFYERIDATISDPVSSGVNSNLVSAEYYIDTDPGFGKGGAMFANDGVFNSSSEAVYAAVDLYNIAALSQGTHTVYVRGKDAAGNWGATATTTLLIDKTAPTFSGISLAPNPTNGAPAVTLTVNGASDTGGSGVAGGEYWICPPTCAAPAAGGGTAFTGLTTTIPVGSLATGTYTVSARIRDAAGNWSTGTNGIRSATLTVWADAIFSDGFESGNFGAWSATSTNSTTRLNVTAAAALVGTRGMQAQGNNTNYVQYNFGTTAIPAAPTYDARFYFRPNGNTSTGQDILAAATSSAFGTTLFRVRYRLNGGIPQVQIQLGTANTNATWTSINGGTANNVIEVVWQAAGSGGPNPGTLRLYVNGVLSQTLTTTSTGSVAAVRFGSVTSGGSNTLEYFDAFASKRTVSPLFGP